MHNILTIAIQLLVILLALSVHESAHAWMAERFGDPTGRLQGRISLNPIAHIDPIGTIIFPVMLAIIGAPVFGWAKPVQVNPFNLRNPRKDSIYIAAAGPVSNIIMAIGGIVVFIILKQAGIVGSIYVTSRSAEAITILLLNLILINIFLAIFNLLPVPPLDGSRILEGVLEGEALRTFKKIEPYGFFILMAVIYLGVFDLIARPVINFIMKILFYG
ncbi:MAG: site-2 protease family protein [Candidatus Aminicenantes bacterium]|nr:site-2 protease family protein [Candidatus Aminicenantes bacterium]